jgi:hypothetical protein
MDRAACDEYKSGRDDRLSKGRYNLEEAAILIGKETGERADEMLEKLKRAVLDKTLPVYEPDKLARYQCDTVRHFYEEAYANDLNAWLAANEPRIAWRFPDPQGNATDKHIKPVPRFTAQEAAILHAIRSRGHDPLALPKHPNGKPGVKAEIRALCLGRKDTFSTRSFEKAWERLRSRRDILAAA